MMTALFAVLGAAAGVAQSALLLRAARRAAGGLSFALRLVLAAGVLVPAARAGHLAAAALAWSAGFAGSAIWIRRRLR